MNKTYKSKKKFAWRPMKIMCNGDLKWHWLVYYFTNCCGYCNNEKAMCEE